MNCICKICNELIDEITEPSMHVTQNDSEGALILDEDYHKSCYDKSIEERRIEMYMSPRLYDEMMGLSPQEAKLEAPKLPEKITIAYKQGEDWYASYFDEQMGQERRIQDTINALIDYVAYLETKLTGDKNGEIE